MGLAMLVASLARTESQVAIYGTLLVLVLAGLSGTGVESAPGKKDALKLRYFINNAKAYEDDDGYEDYADLAVADIDALADEVADDPDVYDWEEDGAIDVPVEDDDIA